MLLADLTVIVIVEAVVPLANTPVSGDANITVVVPEGSPPWITVTLSPHPVLTMAHVQSAIAMASHLTWITPLLMSPESGGLPIA